ncbi:hypothetical protein QAD02_002589 [Eretmocerus hayati]|uniref:Uncharacterized protein n=1 Tax=Eretmocerus hayati TaxID=131215 RepID=A0ACC2NJG3_9HYME|nr:hypothetical protein QAD02_002589 [Eretmocerus hayati]
MKSKVRRKRSIQRNRQTKIKFLKRLEVGIKSTRNGKTVSTYLDELKKASYRSTKWIKLTGKVFNSDCASTRKNYAKLTKSRFHRGIDDVYLQLGVPKEETHAKSRPAPKVIAEKDNSERRMGGRNNGEEMDLDIWQPRSAFPAKFPDWQNSISGHTIRRLSWNSLNLDEFLDDMIINPFLKLIYCNAKEKLNANILPFDIHLVQDIISGKPLGGFSEWIRATDFNSYGVWLLPLNDSLHWTLLVVVPSQKLFVYLDSNLGDLSSKCINSVCAFMKNCWKPGEKVYFSNWTIFTPRDIPSQYRAVGGKSVMSMNCGPHLLTWAHIICSGNYVEFKDETMDSIRRRVAEILLKCDGFDDRNFRGGNDIFRVLRSSKKKET